MEMDKRSLEIDIYEHFKDYFNTRSVGIITDKQFVLYTQYDINDGFNHDSAIPYLDKKVFPDKHYNGFYQNSKDITFAGESNDLYFFMPSDETISKAQQQFLYYIVDEINRYNNEVEERKKVKINILTHTESNSIVSTDSSEVKNILSHFLIRDTIVEREEIIIGKTLNDIGAYTQILDESQIQLLNSFGLSSNHIPKTLLSKFESLKLSNLEQDYLKAIGVSELDAETLDFQNICVKDIIGTTHPDYKNKAIIDAFASLKRETDIIKNQQQNPEYYTTILKDKNRKLQDEITVVEKNNKYYITQGNNRLIVQLVSYLSEREKCLENEQAIKDLDKKYTFYLKCAKIPANKEEMILITLLKKINKNCIIQKSKQIGELYQITIDQQTTTLNTIEDLKLFMDQNFNECRLNKLDELEEILSYFLLENYYISKEFSDCVKDMEMTQKIFKLREFLNKKYKSLGELFQNSKDEISYGTLLEVGQTSDSDLYRYYAMRLSEVEKYEEFSDLVQQINTSKLDKEELKKINDLIIKKNNGFKQHFDTLNQKQAEKMIQEMLEGKLDVNGQQMNIKYQREMANNKVKGFAKVWILGMLTTMTSISIIVLGIMLSK